MCVRERVGEREGGERDREREVQREGGERSREGGTERARERLSVCVDLHVGLFLFQILSQKAVITAVQHAKHRSTH